MSDWTNLDAVLVKTLCDVRDCVFKILQHLQGVFGVEGGSG